MALETDASFQYHRGPWALDLLFPKFAIARAQSPTREARVLPDPIVYLCSRTVMGRVFVACALGCLFGCGPKNGAARKTRPLPMRSKHWLQSNMRCLFAFAPCFVKLRRGKQGRQCGFPIAFLRINAESRRVKDAFTLRHERNHFRDRGSGGRRLYRSRFGRVHFYRSGDVGHPSATGSRRRELPFRRGKSAEGNPVAFCPRRGVGLLSAG